MATPNTAKKMTRKQLEFEAAAAKQFAFDRVDRVDELKTQLAERDRELEELRAQHDRELEELRAHVAPRGPATARDAHVVPIRRAV